MLAALGTMRRFRVVHIRVDMMQRINIHFIRLSYLPQSERVPDSTQISSDIPTELTAFTTPFGDMKIPWGG